MNKTHNELKDCGEEVAIGIMMWVVGEFKWKKK